MNPIEILNRIQENKEKEKVMVDKEFPTMEWNPMEASAYTVPSFYPPTLTKPNIKKIQKVMAFVDMVKYKRVKEGTTIMPIPTTNKQMIRLCGNQREVSRLIGFMVDIGLIGVYDDSYQFKAHRAEDNKSKTYYYYYENEVRLLEWCKEKGIEKVEGGMKNVIKNKNCGEIFADREKVRFRSNLKLMKPQDMSVKDFEGVLLNCLYENYKGLRPYQEKADVINEKYYSGMPEMALRFVPSFTWDAKNNYVRKIGIRCTNSLVAAKKDDSVRQDGALYRSDVLRRYNLEWEKDVKSSVPRITRLLNYKEWVSEEVDVYEMIYKRYVKLKEVAPMPEDFIRYRDAIKALHMRAYFDSGKSMGAHVCRAMGDYTRAEEVATEMRLLRLSIIYVEGCVLYDSEIFFHESCIYLDVLEELLGMGYFVWLCYDAFYAGAKEGQTEAEYQKICARIVREKATAYARTAEYEGEVCEEALEAMGL